LDQDEADGEGEEGGEVGLCLLAAQGDALEALELADGLLDPGAAAVERVGEALGGRDGVGLVRELGGSENDAVHRFPDQRHGAAGAGGGSVCATVVALVGDDGAGRGVRPEAQEGLEHRRIGLLAAGDLEGDGMAVEIGLQVDFRGVAPTRAAEPVRLGPPLAPAAETWARTTVLSNICTTCAVRLHSASMAKNASNTPALLSRENRFQTAFQ
jgi:hypothetical protein